MIPPTGHVFLPFDECHSDGDAIMDVSGNEVNGVATGVMYVEGPTGNPTGMHGNYIKKCSVFSLSCPSLFSS